MLVVENIVWGPLMSLDTAASGGRQSQKQLACHIRQRNLESRGSGGEGH